MSKAFKVVYAHTSFEFPKGDWAQAFQHVANQDDARFFLYDTEVTASDFAEACHEGADQWRAKKSKTHVRVRVLFGTSAACYVWKWIPRNT